jgi:uncharacterized protein YPO0396
MPKQDPDVGTVDASVEAGFRLERLELWNWGTFDGEVQTLEPRGGWGLLVGDNGSGKSTATDALRTLLVPPRMLNYNDASGDGRRAAGRDRTRRSYVRGAWASSSTVDSSTPSTQYLREAGILSAIAAVFSDARRRASVTIAQILWEHEEQVRELYAVTAARRGLKDLMAGYSNTAEIRRAARRDGWTVEDSFAAYAERMRELLHIPGDKALEVFNRAIGMKEVSDIDAFVRQFMLPSADTFAFIRDTVQPHYRTLLDCWAAIEQAERQIALLSPVADRANRINDGEQRIDGWRQLQEMAVPYFARRHLVLLREYERGLLEKVDAVEASRHAIASRLTECRSERDVVNASIASSDVGLRLQSIERELEHAEQARRNASYRRARIEPASQLLGVEASLSDTDAFNAARPSWEKREQAESVLASEAEERRAAKKHEQELALKTRLDRADELESVERNRVNIPREFHAIRMRVAQAIGVPTDRMPFAGELIEVRSEFEDWTGGIERLLRGFGLALLVPDNLYRPAAEFINSTVLGLRLTFHRVPVRPLPPPSLSTERVPGRLEFRTDHPLHSWVANELVRRFNHRCCASIAELEMTDRGLTRQGLIREGTRHVKDDVRTVDDLSSRILGWSTDRKIAALKQQIADADRQAESAAREAAEATREATAARNRASAARELMAIADFSEIDPQGWSKELLRLRTEQETLERSSDTLRALRERLRDLDETIRAHESELNRHNADLGRLHDRIDNCRNGAHMRERQLADAGGFDHDGLESAFAEITAGLPPLTLDNAEQLMHSAHQSLQGRISNEQRKVNEAADKMIGGMSDFLNQFPEFKQTLQADRAYADSFTSALQRIEQEDLPRHRERFEHYLNENLVGDLLMLNRRLDEHRESIEARIDETNEALRRIEYGDETYVQLRLVSRPSQEVSEFRRQLRDCFEHGIAPAPEERLRIFERVRVLLDQFQTDPEGTQRVTDVRTWYVAGVQELRRSDDAEVNYYAATTGKSGGQKAKLAFTILASALSAQYGLSNAASDAPNFRLVVIDEAFSRTDESNSTRAMQLFSQLGFQLLIVGPFDAKAKLAVPFVQTIHLASNPAGSSSRLMALTREQVEAGSPPESKGRDIPESATVTAGPSTAP